MPQPIVHSAVAIETSDFILFVPHQRLSRSGVLKKRYSYIVLTNCMPGTDDLFNEWYNQRHIGDLLRIPGFTGARRYRTAEGTEVSGEPRWRYLAVYDIETADLQGTLHDMLERGGTAEMLISDTLDVASVHAVVYEAIEPLLSGDLNLPEPSECQR